jgi:hypothetical protein
MAFTNGVRTVATGTKEPKRIGRAAQQVEPEVLDPTTTEGGILAAFREEMQDEVRKDVITLKVPGRPRMKLMFDPNFSYDDFQAWTRKSLKGKGDNRYTDFLNLSRIVLSRTNVGVLYDGVEVPGSNGDCMVITEEAFHKHAGAPLGGTAAAIKKVYGNDADIIRAMKRIVEAAGFSIDDDDLEDDSDGPLEP